MSNRNMWGTGPGRNRFGLPQGEEIAKYTDYEAAQQAVAKLAAADFPIKATMIVGEGLKSIERVTGKLSYARVALSGGSSGIWLGMLFALFLLLLNPVEITGAILMAALLIGAGVGAIIAVIFYSLNRRRREYTSIMQMIASTYSLQVTPELADQARGILQLAQPRPQQPPQPHQQQMQAEAPHYPEQPQQHQPPVATNPDSTQPPADSHDQNQTQNPPQKPPANPFD